LADPATSRDPFLGSSSYRSSTYHSDGVSLPTPPGGLTPEGPVPLPSGRRPGSERLLRRLTGGVSSVPLLALLFILATLIVKAWPAIRLNGLGFFTGVRWNPGSTYGATVTTHGVAHPAGASYGAMPLITGTLESSAVAIVVAVPVSIGAAILVADKLPRSVSSGVGLFLELLAGIPSVVFGLWGAVTFGPVIAGVASHIAPHIPDVPVLDFFRPPTGHGEGLLTSGLVLAVMIVPIIASTTRDLLRGVPVLAKEGAQALGMTEWEVTKRVTLPWVAPGIVGASVLGLARALGETIAVAMVSGAVLGANAHNIYSTMTTIAATIVSQLDSALTDATGFAVSTLAEAALALMLITLVTNVAARLLVRRVSGTALPVGRGV
jgi:phosphate transport system permease protein